MLRKPEQKHAGAALSAGASEAELAGNTLTVTCAPEIRLPVLRAVEHAGGTVERFSTDDATLEEMYLKYVAKNGLDPGGAADHGMRPGTATPR
jgi:ABC-2 type transport system ATP-binding protein